MQTQTLLGRQLGRAREQTDELFRLVRPDSLYERTIPERHRILFYLGHLEAFDWNLIGRYALDLPSFHATFDHLFAFGIDPPEGQLPCDQPSDWPAVREVEAYNQRVRETVDSVLADVSPQLLHVAIEHRLMHAETFAYILHQLPYERKVGTGNSVSGMDATQRVAGTSIDIPAGRARLGLDLEETFGWDNEFEAHEVDVPAFSLAKYKVTNSEYLDFVRAGAAAPFFWTQRQGEWFYRGMFSEYPLPPDCPVYVTQKEAQAYAEWRGKSLLSEPQFHRAASASQSPVNTNFDAWDPVPVTEGERAGLPSQMIGNGWEWTSTVFAPFPGFVPFPSYANYSAPFFDGQHYVLKGASPRTASCFLRPSFRNWFRPSYPYLYATFRLVES